ncbi:hypothetical protein TNCT_246381 [Trichonephila clavata]|uniref:Uncharacterized protein n=1 Tax=Trichonephila clavata TaxID=2740835 RepID=A0A8X6G7H2_TRICU|nr:hypothetical protein TNCT_246381 [Trichonephila clavata]
MGQLLAVMPDNPIRNVNEPKSFNYGNDHQAYGSVPRNTDPKQQHFPSRRHQQHQSHVMQQVNRHQRYQHRQSVTQNRYYFPPPRSTHEDYHLRE